MKEYMAKMPDNIDSKKECDEYYKTGCKEIKEKLKDEKKADKVAAKNDEEPKKRVKKIKVDEDGNEIEKVKKPPNAYNKYIQEQRPNVKNDFPELNNKELFSKIAEMWKNHKENTKENSNNNNDNSDGYKTAEEDTEDENDKAVNNKKEDEKKEDDKAVNNKEEGKSKKGEGKKGEGKKKEKKVK
jgi:hypothetical protein